MQVEEVYIVGERGEPCGSGEASVNEYLFYDGYGTP